MKHTVLEEAGLKQTAARIKILELFETNPDKHLSAEELHELLKKHEQDVPLATIYRVLAQFEAASLLKRHNFSDDRAVFELETKNHHDHLVCVKCNKVEEFLDEMIESRQVEIARQHKFEISDHNLTIYGICHTCQQP